MDIQISTLLTAFLTSTFTSSIIYLLVKSVIERRIEFGFQKKLEEIKSGLEVKVASQQLLDAKRYEDYKKLAELVYRTRNSLRDIIDRSQISLDFSIEFLKVTDLYVEQIYLLRLVLEHDDIFLQLHDYKNSLINAKHYLLDWLSTNTQTKIEDLEILYKIIDAQYEEIISLLNNFL